MSEHSSSFQAKSTVKAADKEHRRKINFNIARYNAVVPVGRQQFTDVQLAREKAKNIKWKAIETLDKQLETFEANIAKKGQKLFGRKQLSRHWKKFLSYARQKNALPLLRAKAW